MLNLIKVIKMRQVSKFFIAALVAANGMLAVSCDKIKDLFNTPTITVNINGQDRTELEIEVGEAVNLRIDYKAEAGLSRIEFEQENGGNLTGFPKTSGFDNTNNHQYQGTIPASLLTVGTKRFTTRVTDKDDQSANKTITITVKEESGGGDDNPQPGDPINTWTNKTLGSLAHASTAGSSFATSDGSVYSIADAKTNSGKVDMIYSNGASYPLALLAPNLDAIGSLPENSSNRVETWTTRNATKLAKLSNVTVADFDGCTDDKLIVEKVTNAAVSANNVTNLAANNIVGFITAGGKRGLIKVISTDTSSSANQSITITVKVQK